MESVVIQMLVPFFGLLVIMQTVSSSFNCNSAGELDSFLVLATVKNSLNQRTDLPHLEKCLAVANFFEDSLETIDNPKEVDIVSCE